MRMEAQSNSSYQSACSPPSESYSRGFFQERTKEGTSPALRNMWMYSGVKVSFVIDRRTAVDLSPRPTKPCILEQRYLKNTRLYPQEPSDRSTKASNWKVISGYFNVWLICETATGRTPPYEDAECRHTDFSNGDKLPI